MGRILWWLLSYAFYLGSKLVLPDVASDWNLVKEPLEEIASCLPEVGYVELVLRSSCAGI